MTLVRATTSPALTSNPAHWSGTIAAGATIAAGGNAVTIDSAIPSGDGTPVTAGGLIIGAFYRIILSGSTVWTSVGAGSNNIGTEFQATGAGSGTGQAVPISTITTLAAGAATAGGSFSLSAAVAFSSHVRAGTTTCLSILGSNSYTLSNVRIFGGSGTNAVGINHTGSGLVTIAGSSSVLGGSGSASHGVVVNGSGLILRVDNALEVRGTTTASFGINLLAGSIDVINNSVVNGSLTATNSSGINGAAGTTINLNNTTVNGGVVAGITTAGSVSGTANVFNAATAEAMIVTGNGIMYITASTYNASSLNYAITALSQAGTHFLGGIVNSRSSAGTAQVALNVRRMALPSGSVHQHIYNQADNSSISLYSPDASVFGNPAASDVRVGVAYGPGGGLTGTLVITTSPTLEQIATAVWVAPAERTLSSGGVQAISDRLERVGGPVATIAGFLAQLNAIRLQNVATSEVVASVVATALSAM